jgi:hypothetical protein
MQKDLAVLSSAAVLEADSKIAQLSEVRRRETIPANRSVAFIFKFEYLKLVVAHRSEEM